ncbi:hypothetical protein [Victivallis vadensis]|uniref:hypothetical protein n=1 Tax=Victivallis vadensis TaxID=172901 RepID=UPI00307FB140
MGYDYTAEHIETLLAHCREVGILTAPGFWDTPVETLRGYYNGIGPDAWSSRLRRLTTFLLRPFELAALPHDYEYATAPRTYLAFTIANLRFAANAMLEAYHRHPVRLPLNKTGRRELRRLAAMILFGLLLAVLCQCFGWKGFKNTKIEDYKNA